MPIDEDTTEVRMEKTITAVAKRRKQIVAIQHEEELSEVKKFKQEESVKRVRFGKEAFDAIDSSDSDIKVEDEDKKMEE